MTALCCEVQRDPGEKPEPGEAWRLVGKGFPSTSGFLLAIILQGRGPRMEADEERPCGKAGQMATGGGNNQPWRTSRPVVWTGF